MRSEFPHADGFSWSNLYKIRQWYLFYSSQKDFCTKLVQNYRKWIMAENTVFLLLTALIRNFYKFLMGRLDTNAFGLKKSSGIKAFVFKFISVPAKWIRTGRHHELNFYTNNISYMEPFALADG